MRKIFVGLLAGLLAAGMILSLCAMAADEEKGEGPERESLISEKETDKDFKDLTRTAIVVRDSKGNEWVYIRLSGSQYALIKSKIKKHKDIRVSLHQRQVLAAKQALKLDQSLDKVILCVDAKHMYFSNSLLKNSGFLKK